MKDLIVRNWYKIVAALILLGALGTHPYSYYDFLRWVTCAVALYSAFEFYEAKKPLWMVVFIAVGLVFNPLWPFYMSRDNWQLVDLAVAILFLATSFVSPSHRGTMAE